MSSWELTAANAMSSNKSSIFGNSDDGVQPPSSASSNWHYTERRFGSRNLRADNNFNHFLDPEAMELYSRARAQEEEILLLRDQVANACVKELQLLNEKHALERKFSDLRMALDEKQNDAINSALTELSRRKGDIEENLKLAHDLKVVDDEIYIFTSSLLSLLADYGIRPHVINSSAISNSVKGLYDQLLWRIRTSHASFININTLLGNQAGDGSSNNDHQLLNISKGQLLQTSTVPNGTYSFNPYQHENHLEQASNTSRFIRDHDFIDMKGMMLNHESRHPFANNNLRDFKGPNSSLDDSLVKAHTDKVISDTNVRMSMANEEHASSVSEGEGLLPGIEGFQIIGEAKPGSNLLACGFPVHGTSLCTFQWVRHLQNGTRQYIEGATNPDYVVTVDDVDKLIAVECIPLGNNGIQGDLVRLFANDQKKITCDPDMQLGIETYISAGRATFNVLLLMDSSDSWEPATFILSRVGYQVMVNNMKMMVIEEKYSPALSIRIPGGLSPQFVLTSSDSSCHPFNANNDVRLRDILVLTMRYFQRKALDDKRKGKA